MVREVSEISLLESVDPQSGRINTALRSGDYSSVGCKHADP
jgi:hypothetical protein